MEEGHYIDGKRNGYSRNISSIDGHVELGYYKNDLMHGKGCHYNRINKNGMMNNGYEGFEGYFENDVCVQDQFIEGYE